jgi:RHS repeat-associated protein
MTRRDPSGTAVYNFQYDAENRMVAVSGSATASFVYDGDGNRVQSTVGGVTTVHLGAYFEWTGSTSTMKKYYSAGGARVAVRTGASTLNFMLTDHLGSTSVTTDSIGAFGSENRYKAWGELRYASGTLPTKFTYTGQYSNVADFGLMYYGARWYDSSLSRFAQADTIVPGAGNPQAWDRYAYTNNNPIKFIDPTGHTSACAGPNADSTECQHVNSKYNRWVDRNKDGKISKKEAIAYFVRNLITPGIGLHGSNLFGGSCTTNTCEGQHPGVDFTGAMLSKTKIQAAFSGTVVDVDSDPQGDFGKKVVIEHKVFGFKFYSIYAHLSATTAIQGSAISAGGQVGLMGNTPWESGEIHLHFEVRQVLNVKLDDQGNYKGLPTNADSYWPDTSEEMSQNFVNIGPRFGYNKNYPDGWPR